jgi:hypothetical protein
MGGYENIHGGRNVISRFDSSYSAVLAYMSAAKPGGDQCRMPGKSIVELQRKLGIFVGKHECSRFSTMGLVKRTIDVENEVCDDTGSRKESQPGILLLASKTQSRSTHLELRRRP